MGIPRIWARLTCNGSEREQMATAQNIERRKNTRYEVGLHVSMQSGDRILQGVSRDISLRGIFVGLTVPLPVDDILELAIDSDAKNEPIRIQGKVVHSLAGVGNGIEFVAPTHEAEQAIAALIRSLKGDAE